METISNVLYVLNLKSNLLSIGQLEENGHVITLKNGVCEIYDPCKGVIAAVKKTSNRLYPLKIESIQTCLIVEGSFMAVAFSLWSFAFWWLEDLMTKEYGERSS